MSLVQVAATDVAVPPVAIALAAAANANGIAFDPKSESCIFWSGGAGAAANAVSYVALDRAANQANAMSGGRVSVSIRVTLPGPGTAFAIATSGNAVNITLPTLALVNGVLDDVLLFSSDDATVRGAVVGAAALPGTSETYRFMQDPVDRSLFHASAYLASNRHCGIVFNIAAGRAVHFKFVESTSMLEDRPVQTLRAAIGAGKYTANVIDPTEVARRTLKMIEQFDGKFVTGQGFLVNGNPEAIIGAFADRQPNGFSSSTRYPGVLVHHFGRHPVLGPGPGFAYDPSVAAAVAPALCTLEFWLRFHSDPAQLTEYYARFLSQIRAALAIMSGDIMFLEECGLDGQC
jgi:hypothetical protein